MNIYESISQSLPTILPICAFIGWAIKRLDRKFDQIDKKFDKIDERFERVYERFDKIDERFERVYERFDKLDNELKEIRKDISKLSERLAIVETESIMAYMEPDNKARSESMKRVWAKRKAQLHEKNK